MSELNKTEKIVLSFVGYIVTMGLFISYANIDLFKNHYVAEDKTIEWLTFVILLAMSLICFKRYKLLKNKRGKLFSLCTLAASFIFLFGAGEEASWGQRQLKFTVPQFFVDNNSQHEANIHNLVVNGKKINKIIFGTGLAVVVSSYLLLLPYYYRRKKGLAKKVDELALPIAQYHHVFAYLLLFIITSLIPTSKRGELLEFGGVSIFLLILLFPLNKKIFNAK
jgi:hypothetical protein